MRLFGQFLSTTLGEHRHAEEEPGLLLRPGSYQEALRILPWRGMACGVHVLLFQGLTLALALRFLPAWVLTDWRNLRERREAPERHRQRQHQRCDQQRDALPHSSHLPSLFLQKENRPTSSEVAGCATGSTRFLSAHLDEGGLQSLYTSEYSLIPTQANMISTSQG